MVRALVDAGEQRGRERVAGMDEEGRALRRARASAQRRAWRSRRGRRCSSMRSMSFGLHEAEGHRLGQRPGRRVATERDGEEGGFQGLADRSTSSVRSSARRLRHGVRDWLSRFWQAMATLSCHENAGYQRHPAGRSFERGTARVRSAVQPLETPDEASKTDDASSPTRSSSMTAAGPTSSATSSPSRSAPARRRSRRRRMVAAEQRVPGHDGGDRIRGRGGQVARGAGARR